MDLRIKIPKAHLEVLAPRARYKVLHGGRGGAKSHSIARMLVARGAAEKLRILCAREYQTSIGDSVHRLLSDTIQESGLGRFYNIGKTSITSSTGSEFLFKGIKIDPNSIKSTEGIDIAWVEEAHRVSKDSWNILIPTIRAPGSEIWMSFNPDQKREYTYDTFVAKSRADAIVRKVGYQDNPWFPAELDAERRFMAEHDPEAYLNIWEGFPKELSEAIIFRGKYSIETFETPEKPRFFHGLDFGFAADPTAFIRCFIKDEVLYIDQEAWGIGVEIDHTPDLIRTVATAADWPIKADSARPETISYIRRQGFNIAAADKWPGCVEDGIAHLRGFKRIVIHERCRHTAEEFGLYSYKTDRTSGDILPEIVDKHNHCIDALRYALDGYIQARGGMGVWSKLST